jgi:hypothetical protein
MTANTGTPFTVYDTANVALQATSPADSGYAASRPDLIGNPNSGSARRSLDDRTPFRGWWPPPKPGSSATRGEISRADQGRERRYLAVEGFQTEGGRATAIPRRSLLTSPTTPTSACRFTISLPNFGRILTASQARLMQFALKLIF